MSTTPAPDPVPVPAPVRADAPAPATDELSLDELEGVVGGLARTVVPPGAPAPRRAA